VRAWSSSASAATTWNNVCNGPGSTSNRPAAGTWKTSSTACTAPAPTPAWRRPALGTLDRGYALVEKRDGHLVQSVREVLTGERIQVRLHDGRLACRIEDKTERP